MRIAFYANHHTYGGLSDNGGTNTILRSADALRKLGHKVYVVARSDKFTYFKHPKPVKKIPKCDVCIAASPADVPPMVKECPKGVKKAVWVRGWPVWSMKPSKIEFILKNFYAAGNDVFTNSRWIEDKLEKKGINAYLLYAGIDFDIWKPPAKKPEKLTIGTLYHKFHKTKGYRFWRKVKKQLGDEYNYVEIGRKPMSSKKLWMSYQQAHIWFSATILEGWHNVPAEAGLCAAVIVCNDNHRNGMVTAYAFDCPKTAMIYKAGDVDDAVDKIKNVDFNCVRKFNSFVKHNYGTRQEHMKGLVKHYDNR